MKQVVVILSIWLMLVVLLAIFGLVMGSFLLDPRDIKVGILLSVIPAALIGWFPGVILQLSTHKKRHIGTSQ
mgnify:CR=1 FL=1